MRIVLLGSIILSISYGLLSEVASAYGMWDITAPFGNVSHIHPNGHTGVDFAIPADTPLKSVVDGTVEKVRDTGNVGYGKSVQIRTPDGRLVIYAHLNDFNVSVGDYVREGQIIGESGSTGRSTGNHLHFEVREGGKSINPMPTIMDGRVNKLIDGSINVVRDNLIKKK
jgi:murein DD-endopeptidase MepM/ murein hydrolase activator NlpD